MANGVDLIAAERKRRMMYIDTNGFFLDDIVRDTVSNYQGRIVAFTQWTTGCARATIQAPMAPGADKVPETYGNDVTVLELVEAGPRRKESEETAETQRQEVRVGGPRPEPQRGR